METGIPGNVAAWRPVSMKMVESEDLYSLEDRCMEILKYGNLYPWKRAVWRLLFLEMIL
jgi:hypothetical protein